MCAACGICVFEYGRGVGAETDAGTDDGNKRDWHLQSGQFSGADSASRRDLSVFPIYHHVYREAEQR